MNKYWIVTRYKYSTYFIDVAKQDPNLIPVDRFYKVQIKPLMLLSKFWSLYVLLASSLLSSNASDICSAMSTQGDSGSLTSSEGMATISRAI